MRKLRKKYKSPRMAWDTAQIDEQRKILSEYGLRNKRELLRTVEILRNYRRRARELEAKANEAEKKRLIDKLVKFGLLEKDKGLDDVLALTARDLLNRRLQTIVFKRGMAKTVKEARQFIVHRKVEVGGRKVNIPSYLVTVDEESKLNIKTVAAATPQKIKAEHAVTPKPVEEAEAKNGE